MPELPEAETIRRVLEPQLKGLSIDDVQLRHPGVIAHPSPEAFTAGIKGQTIDAMSRRGKFLIIGLANGSRIVIHLRMTGCLLASPAGYPEEKHTHVLLQLAGRMELRFSDTRRFGRLWLIRSEEADPYTGMDRLGPEPFDNALTSSYLSMSCGRSRRSIKECLMDQGIIAGIGNIYSDEILFSAGIHPAKPAAMLTEAGWERLAAVIPERLSYFIGKNTITAEEYLEGKGKDYRNTPFLEVYGRDGMPCPRCGTILRRLTVGGRSSVYCPSCQPCSP